MLLNFACFPRFFFFLDTTSYKGGVKAALDPLNGREEEMAGFVEKERAKYDPKYMKKKKKAASKKGGKASPPPAPAKVTVVVATRPKQPKRGFIESNFDKTLLRVFSEVKYWERFKGPQRVVIPYAAHDVANQRDKLRSVREHVMLVVRAYV